MTTATAAADSSNCHDGNDSSNSTLGLPLTDQDHHDCSSAVLPLQSSLNNNTLETTSAAKINSAETPKFEDETTTATRRNDMPTATGKNPVPLKADAASEELPPLSFGAKAAAEEAAAAIASDDERSRSLSPSQLLDTNNENSTLSTTLEMEERVAELEAKLSTLTILLQAATKRPNLSLSHYSPVVTRSVSPSIINHNNRNGDETPRQSPPPPPPMVPPWEASSSPLGQHHRRLSEVLLNDDSFPSTPSGVLSPKKMLPKQQQESTTISKRQSLVAQESSPNLPKLQQPILLSENTTKPIDKQSKPSRNDWISFLNSFQESTADVDIQMEEFVRVPSKVEQLLIFGLWICVDSFLYVVTILPIRFVWSCLLGIMTVLGIGDKNGPFRFHRRHLYQLMQVSIIFIVYHYVLCSFSIGKLYHWIRGQVMLKLYLLIAIVEVFDRLMCSLGQDCLDSLYWNTTRRPHSKRMLVSMSVVLVYAILHSFLLFVHVATLNVAMNSADQALLSLLIGGNFAEIKSTVFKKYNKQVLFKITASDICERFKLALFLTLVLILNATQGMDMRMVYDFFYMCGIVWVAELLSDWVKHSFITKFNYIKSSVYPEYSLILAGDVTGIGHEGVNLDHSHAVVKRIGLAQIPLVCVMFRYLAEAARYGAPLYENVSRTTMALFVVAVWCGLVVIKFASGSLLQKVASQKLENAPHVVMSLSKKRPSQKKKD